MTHVLIRHSVSDFDRWKQAYDEHQPARKRAGLEDLHLWRNQSNPNEVFILFGASDLEQARAFTNSADLKDKMQQAGVQGPPDIVFLNRV